MKLRYTGPLTVTFHTAGVGEVGPGAEFTVPDELAESFTRRNDVEEVTEPVESRPVGKRKGVAEVLPDSLPEPADAPVAADTETL